MIEAQDFIGPAHTAGFTWYCGVPCSFLTPFINRVIGDDALHYVSSANEGDAVATATGIALGGGRAVAMMQNSGLGNAVSPLTSLNHVFSIPVLLVCTHRGAPEVDDEPQHALMGRITEKLFDTMQIPWEIFPREPGGVAPALARANRHFDAVGRPYALLMKKGTVVPSDLGDQRIPVRKGPERQPLTAFGRTPERRLTRRAALKAITAAHPPETSVLIATTGYTGRELFALGDAPHQLYMVGSMGCASSLGLGLALARPERRVVVIDGDGAALMRMGNLATIGTYGPSNLTHVVLDNEVHDSTGAQATVSGNVAFHRIAAACGYAAVAGGDEPALLEDFLRAEDEPGPRFLHFKIRPGTIEDLPRPDVTPAAVAGRLRAHLGVVE